METYLSTKFEVESTKHKEKLLRELWDQYI
jgi:hypothetical protein